MARGIIEVSVAYAAAGKQAWLKLQVAEGSTLRDAIQRSGLLERFPEIDLTRQKVGIFGRVTKLDARLAAGDRVEVYRPITADPDEVERRLPSG